MFQSAVSKKVQAVYFIAAASLMYYFLEEYLNVGVHISFRHIFALLLIFSAFVCFLVHPNIARGVAAVKSALIFSAPIFVMIVASLLIWCVERTDFDLISRGLSYYLLYFNLFASFFAAAAFLYVFGEKGIWYNLIALLIANVMMVVTIMVEYGIGTYFQELWTLIRTFADETGEVIVRAEIHELAFCVGAYLLYMLLQPHRRQPLFWLLLIIAAFCFLSAFKRIAIVAIVVALALGWLMKLLAARDHERTASRILTVFLLLVVAALILYILLIKLDMFGALEKLGINTSGRAEIYQKVDRYYTFSPVFLGHGMGFLSYQLNENVSLGVTAVHNDFLQFYIDLGFWGYLLWLWAMTLLRFRQFGQKRIGNQVVTASMLLYMIIVSTTDNTLNYPLFNTAVAIVIMGHGFDERVRETEEKLFSYVSPENRPQPGEHLL